MVPRASRSGVPTHARAKWSPDRLRADIAAAGFTQEQVARAIGVPLRSFATYLRRGGVRPPAERVDAIAAVLNLPSSRWFDRQIRRAREFEPGSSADD